MFPAAGFVELALGAGRTLGEREALVVEELALRRALKGDFEGHRRMVKVAYPIWLYVSITGVIVYFMLYQMYAV